MTYKPSTFERDSLRHLLKTGTKEIHGEADAIFMNAFMKLKISKSVYKQFVAQLYYLYDAMETAIEDNKSHPLIGPIYLPDELNRRESLARDLEYFYGGDWETQIVCMDSMKKYVEHVADIGKNKPELLLAHAYTRYLGDVSGGQILKKIIKRMYRLHGEEGTSFYEFTNITSINSFKDFMNARMNDLDISPGQLTAIVEEAVQAFKYNIHVMEDILDVAHNSDDGFLPQEGDKNSLTDIIVPDKTEQEQSSAHLCPHIHDSMSSNVQQSKSCPKDNALSQTGSLDSDTSASMQSCPHKGKVSTELQERVVDKIRDFTVAKYTSFAVLGSAVVLMFCPWFQRTLKIRI